MKFSLYGLIGQVLCLNLLFASTGNAQKFQYLSDVYIEIPSKTIQIKALFEEIERQTEFRLNYDANVLNDNSLINSKNKKVSVEELLLQVGKAENVRFRRIGLNINAQKNGSNNKKEPIIEEIEDIQIQGKVTDQNGEPLPGASVIIKGSSGGTVTDIDGNYSLTAGEDAVLVISYVGYETIETSVLGRSTIDIMLVEDLETLSEVVITGYQTIAAERATGSFVKMEDEKLDRVVTTTINEKFEGMAPGVLVQTVNGDGGDRLVLNIRGTGTLLADESPLMVVDGFPIEGRLEDINPNDIESINILQDAAAASIWGARAGNGVVVISTKKGSASKNARIEFSSYFSVEQAPDLNDLQLANAAQTIEADEEIFNNGLDFHSFGAVNWFSDVQLNPDFRIFTERALGNITDAEAQEQLNALRSVDARNQYSDLFMQSSLRQLYNLSASGGGESVKYYASLSYTDNKSKYKGDADDRITLTINTDFQLSSKLKASTGLNYSNYKASFNGLGLGPWQVFGADNPLPVYQNILDDNGDPIPVYNHGDTGPNAREQMLSLGMQSFSYNHFDEFKNRDSERSQNNTRVHLTLDYQLLDGLSVNVRGMYEYGTYFTRDYYNTDTYYNRRLTNELTSSVIDPNSPWWDPVIIGITPNAPLGGMMKQFTRRDQAYTFRNQLNYSKELDKHQIDAIAGIEIRETLNESESSEYLGFDPASLYSAPTDWATLSNGVEGYYSPWGYTYTSANFIDEIRHRYVSYYFNAAYTYNNRYTLTVSGRIDDSDLFGAEVTYTPLWSIGGAWNITEEDFFDVSFIDNMKLRVTHGVNGNLPRNSSVFTVLAASRYANTTTGEPYAYVQSPANPGVKWENIVNTNIALDFNMMDFRLNGTLEFYNKRGNDLLAYFPINPIYGYNTRELNNAEITNRGLTLALSATIGNEFKYTPGLNLTYNKNETLNANQPYDDASLFLQAQSPQLPLVGHDVNSAFAYQYAGLDENGYPTVYDAEGSARGIHDELLTDMDAIVNVGTLMPTTYGGLTQAFSYKGFTLHALATFKFGHVFQRPTYDWEKYVSGTFYQDIDQRWRESGDEANTLIPRIPEGSEQWNNAVGYYWELSDELYEDASHIRLKEVSLRYNFSKNVLDKLPFEQIELMAQARDLGLLWTANDKGIDPDFIPRAGGVYNSYGRNSVVSRPSLAVRPTYTFGVKAVF